MICYEGESVWPEGDGYPTLYSIGVGLGRMPRFCGHTREWYPVLAHVLSVAEILPKRAALFGLMHDAQETCMADVPTPWKTQAARRREIMLLKRIYKGHGVEWLTEELQELVDEADATMLAAEAYVIGHPKAEEFWQPPTDAHAAIVAKWLGVCRNFLEPEVAGPMYVEAFDHYQVKLNEYRQHRGSNESSGGLTDRARAAVA